jgi:membrane-associated phospholipid phosphatase
MFPTPLDFWLAGVLAKLAAAHPLFALAVDSGIRHTLFGGSWYGAALFISWVYAAQSGRRDVRLRVLSIVAGSVLAILLTILAGALISWPPPIRDPVLRSLYPSAMQDNLNTNCFPSQSTAAYACIAAGVYSLRKAWGWVLWALVVVAVAFPRMFVGGHYFTDVLAGTLLALAGYAVARWVLEENVISWLDALAHQRTLPWALLQLAVFIWIFQVTVEFREVTWAKVVIEFFLR